MDFRTVIFEKIPSLLEDALIGNSKELFEESFHMINFVLNNAVNGGLVFEPDSLDPARFMGEDFALPDFIKDQEQYALNGSQEVNTNNSCGHVFRKGELIYRCKDCGSDDTCVLCSQCFNEESHKGHEIIYVISSGGGGCCDCGDAGNERCT
jgi:hypothetical protein